MENIPENVQNLRPLSPWAYFGYSILFNIPLIGFIMLIVFSFDNSNINRRNFARSYFCVYALVIIILVVLLACGVSLTGLNYLNGYNGAI